MGAVLKLDGFEKELIEEISTFSGYSSVTVQEILEETFLRQLEFVMNNERVHIPFLGNMLVKYKGDEYISGTRVAKIECFFSASDLFKRLVGDIQDGESDLIGKIMKKKTMKATQEILDRE